METLYEKASLILNPGVYDTSKVYATKPFDGSGDLTFTRSNDTATRVASNGLIEKVRTNIILQSNGFNTATWNKSGAGTGLAPVVTANAGTAPDGTNNAFRIQFDCVGTTSADRSRLIQTLTTTTSAPYACSFYIKAFSAGEVGKKVRFIPEQAGVQSIVTLTADWQRVVVAGIASTTSMNFTIETRGTFTTNTTADVLLAFTQVELGDIATDYIATTSAAVSVGPVANVPRLDYLNSTCPKLILEPQRTNIFANSESASSQPITGTVTISSNSSVSPDGYQNADTITADSTGYLRPTLTVLTGTNFVWSVFLKNVNSGGSILFARRLVTAIQVNISWSGSVPTASVASGSGTVKVVPYGNDWYRFEIATTSVEDLQNLRIYPSNGASASVLFWGGQVETSATYATSYIPTLGAAVTRGADVCSKTGISSLIGQTEGTILIDMEFNALSLNRDIIYLGTSAQAYRLVSTFANAISAGARVSSSSVTYVSSSALTSGRVKIGYGYKSGDHVLYINGVQIGTSANTSVPTGTIDEIQLGTAIINSTISDPISQVLLFKTRLSNSELALLTA